MLDKKNTFNKKEVNVVTRLTKIFLSLKLSCLFQYTINIHPRLRYTR